MYSDIVNVLRLGDGVSGDKLSSTENHYLKDIILGETDLRIKIKVSFLCQNSAQNMTFSNKTFSKKL